MKIDSHEQEHEGYKIRVAIHHDTDMGAPWEEHDGHGIVSEWTSRDKEPGEMVLCSDRHSRRYYDFKATLEVAKRDGWGLGDESKAKLAMKLGHKPTAKEIRTEAVQHDFEYCRGWCNDEWVWLGYTTEIETPDGETLDGDSCWGFEGTDGGKEYMIGEAVSQAEAVIKRHQLTVRETAIAECVP